MTRKQHKTLFLVAALLFAWANLLTFAWASNDFSLTEDEQNWLDQNPSISVAYDGFFPPYSFYNDRGELEGFAVDIFELFSKQFNVAINIYPETTWKKLYSAAQQRKVDVVATMVNREERTEWFNFTEAYILKSLVVVTRDDDQSITRKADLNQKTVALVSSYQYSSRVLKEYPDIKPLYVDTILDGLNAVSTGQADATITFVGAAHHLRTKYLISNLQFSAVYDKNTARDSIGIRKDYPELASILDKFLKSIPENQMQAMREKWLPEKILKSLQKKVELSDEELKWIAQHPNIRLGVDPEFAPFEFIENGSYSGMASDYIQLLNQRLGLNMQIVEGLSWTEVIERAQDQQIDVLPVVGKTTAREKYLNFTDPYLGFHRVIIMRLSTPFIIGLEDLKNKRVGVQINTSHHGYIKEYTEIDPIFYNTLEESLLAVSGGKIDAFIGNVATSTYWIRKLNLSNLKVAASVSGDLQNLHFAVRKDWPQLTGILQKGLNSISEEERQNISQKWLSIKYQSAIDYQMILKVIFAFSVLVICVIIWNIMLNWKVRQRSNELIHYAHYDQLTNLPNRFLIQDRLSQLINEASESRSKVAIFSLDINDFKNINDTFGHYTGDILLKDISSRLKDAIKKDDSLGRLGGNQFLLVIKHVRDSTSAAVAAQNLLICLDKAFQVKRQELTIRASLGIAMFPDDGETPEILLKNADSAAHFSKEKGQGSYVFYTKEMNQLTSRRLQLEQQIRDALLFKQFYVVYQPKVDTKSRKITGFEALLRWSSPALGEVPPEEFIPVLEQCGLIGEVGLFVLDSALEQIAQWQQHFDPELSIAVNVSPCQFKSGELLSQIVASIEAAGINSNSLELEITEGVLMSGYAGVESTLKAIMNFGVKLSIDDFGTGYSSMSYLRQYTFNTLKIDREFVTDLTTDESSIKLVSATIAMAHSLDMEVIAEGVETEEQYAVLEQKDCDQIQGWLISKALLPDQAEELLKNN